MKLINDQAALEEREAMSTGRLSFGCMVDNYGEKIYAIGGSTGS